MTDAPDSPADASPSLQPRSKRWLVEWAVVIAFPTETGESEGSSRHRNLHEPPHQFLRQGPMPMNIIWSLKSRGTLPTI